MVPHSSHMELILLIWLQITEITYLCNYRNYDNTRVIRNSVPVLTVLPRFISDGYPSQNEDSYTGGQEEDWISFKSEPVTESDPLSQVFRRVRGHISCHRSLHLLF